MTYVARTATGPPTEKRRNLLPYRNLWSCWIYQGVAPRPAWMVRCMRARSGRRGLLAGNAARQGAEPDAGTIDRSGGSGPPLPKLAATDTRSSAHASSCAGKMMGLHVPGRGYTPGGWFVERGTYLTLATQFGSYC